jgi:NhaP-type Na+/H+ and K+/H+ antiporter
VLPALFLFNALVIVMLAGADGVYPSFFAEMFSARIRYTAMAVGLQIGVMVTGFAPTAAQALNGGDPTYWIPAALIVTTTGVLAAAAAFTAKETYRVPLEELGRTRQFIRQEVQARQVQPQSVVPSRG